jgi:pilus assembly protein CpaE
MSEHTGANTSVLLPAARVGLYVLDADLRASAKALASDWRFARVTFDIHEGDVESAITAFQGGAVSPELLMVETQNIDDSFTARLEVLAGSCAETTSAVVVGPVNDVYLYRKLIKMGVSDYLVRPLRTEVLAEVIAKALIEKLGTTESRLIAFVGSKGGVGTTALAQATAWGVSGRLAQKTIILDAAGGWSYLSVALGTEPITTMNEASRAANSVDQDSFKRMVAPISEKLSVLATGADMMLDDITTPEALEGIINHLMVSFPVVIVDLSGAAASVKRMIMHKAHEVVIVTTPTLPSLRSARSLLLEIKDVRGGSDKEVELVINMKEQSPGLEVSLADIASAMGRKPALTVPFVPKLFATAETHGKKLTDIAGAEDITTGLIALARKVISVSDPWEGKEKPQGSLMGQFLGKLKAK